MPFMSQTATSPVRLWLQRMSALPSPSKSPIPLVIQSGATYEVVTVSRWDAILPHYEAVGVQVEEGL